MWWARLIVVIGLGVVSVVFGGGVARSSRGAALPGVRLLPAGEAGAGEFGGIVGLSADGRVALVAGAEDGRSVGAAWIFVRQGNRWVEAGPKLTGCLGGTPGFGTGAALSASGSTVLIGCPGYRDEVGAAVVFVRRGTRWVRQGSLLMGRRETGKGDFGYRVALSANGDTAVVGAPYDTRVPGHPNARGGVGAVWLFRRDGSTWRELGSKVVGRTESVQGDFGGAVAVSADGRTAVVGALNANDGRGAAWLFSRTKTGLVQEGRKVSGPALTSLLGWSVALSADGNTALVGAPGYKKGHGAAVVLTRSGSTWGRTGDLLLPADASGVSGFGYAVDLAGNGTKALVGGPRDENESHALIGAVWTFRNTSKQGWAQQGDKLMGATEPNSGTFGASIAANSDATMIAVGAPGGSDHTFQNGTAWIITPQ